MKGYAGMLLRVNLTSGRISKEAIPEEYLRDYLGGAGLAARYLYDEIPAGSDVFGEENKLCFSIGPLNGGSYPTSGRCSVACRSPLTGVWLDASFSGKFGYYMKRAGYDAIIVEGKSARPVYLYVNNDQAELRDASPMWGKLIPEAIDMIYDQADNRKASIAAIGPAGEKMVNMACITNDGGRSAGRGGSGAIMGSKKLKAIYLSGDGQWNTADQDAVKKIMKANLDKVKENPLTPTLKAYGTGVAMAMAIQSGDTPIKNWKLGSWEEGFNKVNGIVMAQTILKQHPPECHACPIQCARYVEIPAGPFQMKGGGPEYETQASFGSLLLNDDLESICYINKMCNEYGVDTISAGSAIAFAMEAYENGVITREDTGGIDLQWGDKDAIFAMLDKLVNREGLGDLLSQGVRKAAQVLGHGTEDYAIHVKGMELPMHDPRAFSSFAATYATSPRGACHCRGYVGAWDGRQPMPEAGLTEIPDPKADVGKGFLSKIVQDYCAAIDSATVCVILSFSLGPDDIAAAISAATGRPLTGKELLAIGERIINLQRAFNNRFGVTRADDNLPRRTLTSTVGGPNEGFVPNLELQLEEYYQTRGWEADGRPSAEKLKELGLDFVVSELYA